VSTPLREIAACHNHDVYVRQITSMDPVKQVVKTDKGDISYDYVVVATGSKTNYFGTKGAKEYAHAIRTLDDARALRTHLNELFEEASEAQKRDQQRLMHIVVIGGGAVGVELAGQIAVLLKDVCTLYPRINRDVFKITLVHSADRLLPVLPPRTSAWALKALEKLNVKVLFNRRVIEVRKNAVVLDGNEVLETVSNVWTAGSIPNTENIVPKELLDEKGFIRVDNTLSCEQYRNIYAAGDAARIYVGGVAIGPFMLAEAAYDEAIVVAENIERALKGKEPKLFEYHSKGNLVPIGDWFAIAEILGVSFKGRFAWWIRRTVYLNYVYNWRDRIRIVIDWTLDIFGVRDTTTFK
jgi:NADH dehydrogenase